MTGTAPRRLAALSTGEETLALHLRALGIGFVRQHRFHPTRQWRFDFAIRCECQPLAVEVQGLLKGKPGAHQRADTLTREYEKLNAAVLTGWRVLLFTPAQIRSGYAIDTIEKALKGTT